VNFSIVRDTLHAANRVNVRATRDIYTAVVVLRSAATIVGTERIELDILHEDGRPVREGTAALIEVGGTRLWAVSLHLKSGCHFDKDLTERADCRTLARQLPILEDWLDEKSEAGLPGALLGDFNRRLDRGSDVVREELDDIDPVDLFKVPHHQELTCSAFSPSPQVAIDYVIVNEALWEQVRVPDMPNIDVPSPQISDHCPVFVDVYLSD
jgi:endonuclease/exonuclease/phosphatase family metal-dependent hydrolase